MRAEEPRLPGHVCMHMWLGLQAPGAGCEDRYTELSLRLIKESVGLNPSQEAPPTQGSCHRENSGGAGGVHLGWAPWQGQEEAEQPVSH